MRIQNAKHVLQAINKKYWNCTKDGVVKRITKFSYGKKYETIDGQKIGNQFRNGCSSGPNHETKIYSNWVDSIFLPISCRINDFFQDGGGGATMALTRACQPTALVCRRLGLLPRNCPPLRLLHRDQKAKSFDDSTTEKPPKSPKRAKIAMVRVCTLLDSSHTASRFFFDRSLRDEAIHAPSHCFHDF